MSYFLGVDGGNTKTLALIAGREGRVLGFGRSGNGDIYGAESPEAAMAALVKAITDAIESAGVSAADIEASGLSIAGADWPEDYVYIENAVTGYGKKITVINDAVGALIAGSPDGFGVAVICGTYGTCSARARTGKHFQGSFWHDAHGGAVPLGRSAMGAVVHSELGIVPPTSLTERFLAFFEERTVGELLHKLHKRDRPGPTDYGRLARLLLQAAVEGDAIAKGIVEEHGRRSGDYALAAARYVGIGSEPFPLVLAGGVMRFSPNPLKEQIQVRVLEEMPTAQPRSPDFEPVFGGLITAYESVGIVVDDSMKQAFTASHPPETVFES